MAVRSRPEPARWRQEEDGLDELIYRRARQRLADKSAARSHTTPTSALTWQEYLVYVLLFVFLGTSFVYTYLAYILREIRPMHRAMQGLSAHRVPLPPAPPPAPPARDPEAEEQLREQLDQEYYVRSESTVPAKILLDVAKVRPCQVASKDAKPPLRLSSSHICTSQRTLAEGDTRLLTLVTTTFDMVVDQAPYTTSNLLHLWPRLGARVRPVLFISDPEDDAADVRRACQLGWDVLVAPACDDDGAPYMADMMAAAQKVAPSRFYGYAHRNTLFDMSLVRTLGFLREEIADFPGSLLVGQRTNLKLLNFRPTFANLGELQVQVRARGTLGWLMSVDYFITTADYTLPRQMVSGTRQLGNWVVWDALLRRNPVIDISNTTTGVHQMAWTAPRRVVFSDPDIPHNFEMTYGMVWCAPLKLRRHGPRRYTLMKRTAFGLCGPGQWSRLPINHPAVPTDREEVFVKGGGIMFQRME